MRQNTLWPPLIDFLVVWFGIVLSIFLAYGCLVFKHFQYLKVIDRMNIEEIKFVLNDAYLGLDMTTVEQTIKFLQEHVGTLSPNFKEYQILAAAAIVGQTRAVSKIGDFGYTKTGITLEGVMKNLQVVTWVTGKWREAPLWIKVKIENLKLSYRIYKKYRFVFEEMFSSHNCLKDQPKFNLMAIFWIAYLFIKHENQQLENTFENIPLLNCLAIILYTEILKQGTLDQGNHIFAKHFNGNNFPSNQKYDQYRSLLIKKLTEVHCIRKDEYIKFDFELIAYNQFYNLRFISDISNQYDRLKVDCEDSFIDQGSFLELTKDKSPYTVKRNMTGTVKAITKKINLLQDSSDQSDKQDSSHSEADEPQETCIRRNSNPSFSLHSSFDISPVRSKSSALGSSTPVTARYQNLGWITSILSKFNEMQVQEFKNILQKYCRVSYKEYEMITLKKIQASVARFSDSRTRIMSIYHFFIHFINRISEQHNQQEKKAIFSNNASIDSFLCLTTDIFNYAYHSNQTSYRENCEIFKVGLLEGYRPLNWFGLYTKLPPNIEHYLYDLEKKILIQQIWERNEGFNLISLRAEQRSKYNTQALLKRLNHHIDARTQQLCGKMSIQSKEVIKINNLVRYILQKKAILLKNQNIDQIIVCSIASILSVNQSKSHFSLTEIFDHYNSLIYSFYSIQHNLHDDSGNQIDILQFYNQIFLQEVQDIINNEENVANILMTPIRLERKRSNQMGLILTPVSIKFRQHPMSLPNKKIKYQQSANNYRFDIANSLKHLDIIQNNQNQENDDYPSPHFGLTSKESEDPKISRSFSFGNIDFS